MKIKIFALLIIALFLGIGMEQSGGAQSEPHSPICMARSNVTDASVIAVVVLPTSQQFLEMKSFAVVECTEVFEDVEAQMSWRDGICTMAATSSDTAQKAFTEQMGLTSSMMCALAEQALGPWRR